MTHVPETKSERRRRIAKTNAAVLERIASERVAAGVCRHCGGPLPCRSEFGDRAPGIRNPR